LESAWGSTSLGESDGLFGEAWISPRYCKINAPGLRSLAAKSPHWPAAGCDGEDIGVILASWQGPLGVLDGMLKESLVPVLREVRFAGVSVRECAGAVRYRTPGGQFFGPFDVSNFLGGMIAYRFPRRKARDVFVTVFSFSFVCLQLNAFSAE
jgi:hypothetical protein